MRLVLLLLVGIFAIVSGGPASAIILVSCHPQGSIPKPHYYISVPAQIVMNKVPVGGVLASFESPAVADNLANCVPQMVIATTLDTKGLTPSVIPNVYKTNFEGVGIRITGWSNNKLYFTPPSKTITGKDGTYVAWPTHIKVEYIRIGQEVGRSGPVTSDFLVEHIVPRNYTNVPDVVSFEPSSKTTELINEVYFTSCESRTPVLNVAMGSQYMNKIVTKTAPKKNFSFEVLCHGPSQDKPPPVKIYFEGDSPADGLLNLSGHGREGVARGVYIELTASDGGRLPFSKENSINLNWLRSEKDAEVYRFLGQAQYVENLTEAPKPGKADATMTYVLEYN